MLKISFQGKELIYQLDQLVDSGWVMRQRHKSLPLLVYCYTPKTQYESNWTELTMLTRGLVIDTEGKIVAKNFSKFYNMFEPSAPTPPKHLKYISYDKVDGSMLSIWNYEGRWNCSTKGSFDNPHTEYGSKLIESCVGSAISTDLTLMTEVVLPVELDDMRRAAPAVPGLYFLGATHTPTLKDLDPTTFYGTGLWQGEFPTIYRNSVDELLAKVDSAEGTEGWVVRYSNGLRLKIKTAWYLRLFRLISRLDSTVKERMLAGDDLDSILIDVPEELKDEIREMYIDIQVKATRLHVEIYSKFAAFSNETYDRKSFARAVQDDQYRPFLFMVYDRKSIMSSLVKAVINGDLDG